MRLLVTRPAPDNERTASALRALGHEVLLAPLLHIEPILEADLGPPPWSAILLTSGNAARAIARHPRRGELAGLPVLAVGRSSAEAARAAGFANVVSADGDAIKLAQLAATRLSGAVAPVLYLAGEDRASELAEALSGKNLSVRTVVIYRAAKAREFPLAVRSALEQGNVDGVLHFSQRAVESYLDCSRSIIDRALAPVHYCLSARIAEPLRRAGAARVRVAAHPDEASLLALVQSAGPDRIV